MLSHVGDESKSVRAYIIHLTQAGKSIGSVAFDRYGLNAEVFQGRSDERAMNQAVSNALAAGHSQKLTFDGYSIAVVHDH